MVEFTKKTMIVAASVAPQCRQLASNFPSGAGMWVTALSPTGAAPATHYISHGGIWTTFAEMIASPEALSAGTGIPVEQAAAILSVCDISDEDGFSAIGRLGLQMATRISINDASKTALESAPGIGAVKAQQIIDGRPWASVADLAGIGLDVAVLDHWYTV